MKLKNRIRLMALIVMALMVMLLAGCGKKPVQLPVEQPVQQPGLTAGSASVESTSAAGTSSDAAASESTSVVTEEVTTGSISAESDAAAAVTTAYTAYTEPLLDEDGTFTTKGDVALYIHTYGKLPSNFMTKKQAKKLGWSGGSLEDFAPGMCIGGDYFGNYEGLLPEDKEYHECDIDTLGKKSRGAKRIIYSDDGYIYYTEDHYESFELLYEP